MPVYNGEQFLEQAIQSALGQSFADFELILSDNASTDRTPEICKAYAARDPRVRYYRGDINRGASWNFNHVFGLARADYFKWAAADDTFEPQFLERCFEALEREPSAVLAYTRAAAIDDQGEAVSEVDLGGYLDLALDEPKERFFQLMEVFRPAVRRVSGWKGLYVFGLLRSDALRKTDLRVTPC
jgi:glycosyltransferase involved in cell wall biosynthesis